MINRLLPTLNAITFMMLLTISILTWVSNIHSFFPIYTLAIATICLCIHDDLSFSARFEAFRKGMK